MPQERLTQDYTLTDDLKSKLQQLVPEAFEDGQLNVDTLRELIGEDKITDRQTDEHFGLNWVGKRDARKMAAQPFTGTLKPCPGEGINEDQTENIFIEGENLEVLKILRKSYAGRIKMIYIDPPYNTGNDFIYKDDFADSTEEYLRKSGQKTGEGLLVSNPTSSGRYHANWLSFMYSRLRVAKDLLRQDGLIFISIDDNEIHNLRSLTDEVFGEENLGGVLIVKSTPNARNYGHVGKMHEYCLMYCKNIDLARTYELEEENKEFKYKDIKSGFNIHPLYNSDESFHKGNRPNLFYPFYINPETEDKDGFVSISLEKNSDFSIEVIPPLSSKNKVQFVWRWGKNKSKENLNQEIIGYKNEDGKYRVVRKMRHTTKIVRSMFLDKAFSGRRGTAEVEFLFKNKVFSFPKPLELLKTLLKISTEEGDLSLDFFSGSSTLAHAVLELIKENKENRKFICVQLPEVCDPKSEAFKAGYMTIAEIGKERIRRVIQQQEDQTGLGFKVFKLDVSNIRRWTDVAPDQGSIIEAESQMEMFSKAPLVDDTQPRDLVTEVMLLQGFPLTAQQEPVTDDITRITHPDIPFTLYVSWAKRLTESLLDTLPLQDDDHFVCLDLAFGNNNSFKQTLSNRCHLQTI